MESSEGRTLGGFLEHKYGPWLRAERPEKRRSVETLQQLQAHFAALLEHPMAEISPWLIEKWRAEQWKHGKAPSAISRDVTVLRSVFSKAAVWKTFEAHPLASVKPLRVDTAGVIRYFIPEEETRLRTTLHQRDADLKATRTRGNAWCRARGYAELPTREPHAYGNHLTPLVLLSLNRACRKTP